MIKVSPGSDRKFTKTIRISHISDRPREIPNDFFATPTVFLIFESSGRDFDRPYEILIILAPFLMKVIGTFSVFELHKSAQLALNLIFR